MVVQRKYGAGKSTGTPVGESGRAVQGNIWSETGRIEAGNFMMILGSRGNRTGIVLVLYID